MAIDFRISGPVTEVLHGETVIDRYRWLEDRGLPETEHWICEQRRRCDDYFSICPGLEAIRNSVRSYLDIEVIDQPARVQDRYFYRRRSRGQEQASIYVRDISSGVERLLVDPSSQGPFTSVSIDRISPSGSLLAYSLRHGGEDKHALCVVDVNSGRSLQDSIEMGYAAGFAFRPTDDGFYYCHESRTDAEAHTIRLHLFREPGRERVVFRAPRTEESRLVLTADAVHLGAIWLRRVRSDIMSDFFIAPLEEEPRWINVFSDKVPACHPFLHQGRLFVLKTAEGGSSTVTEMASDGRDIGTIIPAQAAPIHQVAFANDRIYASSLDDGLTSISCWSLTGEYFGLIDTPKDGSIALLVNHGGNESDVFYTYESFDEPPTILEYVAEAKRSHLWHRRTMTTQRVPLRTRHNFFPANDGTQIPLTLVLPNDMSPDDPAPAILTSYGGFGVPMTPRFSVLATIMRSFGVVLAIAHIRGGGEFGKSWHEAGRKQNRQQAIDDFIGAAEWLCAHRITTAKQLAIFGGSNAGLLVATAMTQHPNLFGAVLSIAPLLDMVRYEHFDLAARWRNEYGTTDDADDFRALYANSPYHHVEEDVDYPPVMFVSGDKDDRCNPAHVRKMAARLQSRPAQRSPVIVEYTEQRGHVPALPLSTRIEALARRIAFLGKELSLSPLAGGGHEEVCH